MESFEIHGIEVNTNKQILSSETRIYKTERFFCQTKKVLGVDNFVLKISESLINYLPQIQEKFKPEQGNCFSVETFDKKFSFLIGFGFQFNAENVSEKDMVFILDENDFENAKSNDQRINLYLKENKIFSVRIKSEQREIDEADFGKLYYISSSEFVNFPMLSKKQQELVEIENQNVLVQGVAGSGKTNICISKIIFAASKGYTGKVLYTTFSRGLLIDTKNKIEIFKHSLLNFINDYKNGRIVFLDKNRKKAIENRLGIFIVADNETNVIKKLELIVQFLETKVDYVLLEDIYKNVFGEQPEMADENIFINKFLKNVSNHQLKSRVEKLKDLSYSVVYKEIYGMIFGNFSSDEGEMISLNDYKRKRENSFSSAECETIYQLAKDYGEFQKTQNLLDNNKISLKLLKNTQKIEKYSLSIVDEVQDFTEKNLQLLQKISVKMFCVGDALQMINPTYFSFAYLKRLMFNEDVTSVAELECNYRNNKKIVEILDDLGKRNIEIFGTHSFVLSGESVDQGTLSSSVFTADLGFIQKLKNQKFENFTILVNDQAEKESLREKFKKQEILIISEIKGLERDTVLLFNVLSKNFDKWQKLERMAVNKKQADENSVYRYYFNLLYVGISRAKHNIFVFEDKKNNLFDQFFKNNFEILQAEEAYAKFTDIISKVEFDDDDIFERIDEFIKLGQFDNARFYADKFEDDYLSWQMREKIDAFEYFVFKGKNKEAGIKLWKAGLTTEAKKQFEISGDAKLIEFLNTLESRNDASLDADVVKFFMDFEDNEDARKLIVETIQQDLEKIRKQHRDTKNKLREFKEKYNGK